MSVVILADERRRARKHHRCDNCQCSIAPGGEYVRQRLIYEGDPYTWKSHADCWELAVEIELAAGGFYEDGLPPLCEQERETLDDWRGTYPHAVTRTELGWELARQRYAREAAE